MIKSVTIINYLGESVKIKLTDGEPEHGMIIQSIEGLGPPKATVNMTDLATMDGSIFNSSRVEKRNIVVHMFFNFASSIEDTRQRTYEYFPIKKPLTFIIETDNRLVETVGVVETNEPDIFSENESNVISLICEDPYFYSFDKNVTVFFGIEPLFEFEFSNESLTEPLLEFGSIEHETEKTIYYNGDAEVGITITIHALDEAGDVITIYNTGTREVMRIDTNKIKQMTGSGIIEGDDIIISSIRGNKKILLLRNGRYTNILNALDKDSDWFQLAKGENIFAYSVDYGNENLQFVIENQIIYEGV